MTVREAIAECSDGNFSDEFGFVLGIDLSENKDVMPEDFTAVTEGVCGISAKLSPRIVIRDFVDGDRAVALSERTEIKLRFLVIKGDRVQEVILRAAEHGVPVRCVFMSGDSTAFEGYMLISLCDAVPAGIYGIEVSAVFSVC